MCSAGGLKNSGVRNQRSVICTQPSVSFVSVHCRRRAIFPTPQRCFRRVRVITRLISPALHSVMFCY